MSIVRQRMRMDNTAVRIPFFDTLVSSLQARNLGFFALLEDYLMPVYGVERAPESKDHLSTALSQSRHFPSNHR